MPKVRLAEGYHTVTLRDKMHDLLLKVAAFERRTKTEVLQKAMQEYIDLHHPTLNETK